jgi:transposase
VEIEGANSGPVAPGTGCSDITVVLGNGRQIRCGSGIGDADLARLIQVVEAA